MHHVLDIGEGSISIMPRPSSTYLTANLQHLKQMGVTKVVSLLEQAEAQKLGLSQEAKQCQQLNLIFEQFEIPDHDLPSPDRQQRFISLVNRCFQQAQQGEHIVIHCRAGIGRSGVLVCCILIQAGFEEQFAIDHVSGARGFAIPDTQEQYDYILDFKLHSQQQ